MPDTKPTERVHYIHRISVAVQERLVGVFVLAAVAIIAGLVLTQIRVSHLIDDRIEYQTFLNNAQGISTETVVSISGIEVGRVNSIDITEDNRIHVRFYVFESFQRLVRTDSTGELSKLSVIGNTSIIIRAGDAELPIMPRGATIKVAEPITVDDLMAEVTPIVERLNDMILTVSDLIAVMEPQKVKTAADDLYAALGNLRQLTEQINSGKGLVGRLAYDRELEQNLLQPTERVGPIVDNVEQITRDVAADMQLVEGLLKKMDQRLDELSGVLQPIGEAATESRDLIKGLQSTTQRVDGEVEQLPELVDKVQGLLDSTSETIDAAQRLWPLSTVLPPSSNDTVIKEQPLDD